MKPNTRKHFNQMLKHLYINPLEKCNLRCKICYTRKTDPILREEEILEFIKRYNKTLTKISSIPNFSDTPPYGNHVGNGPIYTSLQKQSNSGRGRSSKLVSSDLSNHASLFHDLPRHNKLESVTFCGGEVFTLPYFTGLVNKLTEGMHFSDSATRTRRHPLPSVHSPYYSHAQMQRSSKYMPSYGKNRGIFVQIITNGTIDKLDEFKNPNMINLIVSIDGLRDYHDKNRGDGNFDKSIKFLLKARRLGFHTEIFSIVTKQNIGRIEEFENYINKIVILNKFDKLSVNSVKNPIRNSESVGDPSSRNTGLRMTRDRIGVTYHPRKPPAYLLHHPISNIKGVVEGFDFLNRDDLITLMRNRKTFPPKDLGCFQISLASDGKVYGCCEGTVPVGKIDDKIENLFDRLEARLEIWDKKNKIGKCLGCSQPDFVCGLKQILSKIPMSKSKDTKQIQITKSK